MRAAMRCAAEEYRVQDITFFVRRERLHRAALARNAPARAVDARPRLVPPARQRAHALTPTLLQGTAAIAGASLAALLAAGAPAFADTPSPPPPVQEKAAEVKEQAKQTLNFGGNQTKDAPAVKSDSGLPEGNNWRYSDFINAVQNNKVERVRFSKEGGQLQLTATDGRRAQV